MYQVQLVPGFNRCLVQACFWSVHITKENGFQWFAFICSISSSIANTKFFGESLVFTVRSDFFIYGKWLPVRRTCKSSGIWFSGVIIISIDAKIDAKVQCIKLIKIVLLPVRDWQHVYQLLFKKQPSKVFCKKRPSGMQLC